MYKNISNHLIVFITSFSLLFYQITLTRIFSITRWYNLVSIIITLALLGFCISGTLIAFLKKKIDKFFNQFFYASISLFPVSIFCSFIFYLTIPFNPYELGIAPIQIFYLILYCTIIGVPFLIGAFIIGVAIYKFNSNTIYGVNMCGSGLGSLAVILSLHYFHPFRLILVTTAISTISLLIFSLNKSTLIKLVTYSFIAIYTTLLIFNFNNLTSDSISKYKPLSITLLLPNSKIEEERYSPLSVIQTVSADGLRSVAGLSLNSPYEIPEQKMIFFDGSGSSTITPYKGNPEEVNYLAYTPSALPYELIEKENRNNILIVGVGGGEGLLKSELYGFKNIEGLELNIDVIDLMQNNYKGFSGDIYNKPGTTIHSKEARGFIRASNKKYDLIDLSMIDAYNNASSGVYAMNETYLYTVESLQNFYSNLSATGILAISRWINIPPKNCIKMMNICIEALRNEGIQNIEDHIIFIRSIQSATLLLSKTPFSYSQIEKSENFCNRRLFDIIYHKNINESKVNRFIKLSTPVYFESVKSFLYPSNMNKNKQAHNFDVSISTDNKPYFYNFFNYNMLRNIMSNSAQSPPVIEWGYFILILMLFPIIIFAILFILIPLAFIDKTFRISLREISLFSLLGIGYFFIEMPLIQKFILFLSHPVYSVSIVITSLLVFSGIGSFYSMKIFPEKRRVIYSGIGISIIILTYSLLFKFFISPPFLLSFPLKIILTILMISPLGFLMGIPFPFAISQIKTFTPESYPWAWGINGFFSVISIIAASVLSIIFGLTAVFVIAAFCYLLAGILAYKLFSCRWR